MTEQVRFAIIGAGAGGICTGVRLLQAGRDDFAIFEREAGIGGTWWRNTYPGACCDIASHLYSYSFAPNSEWSKPYGAQPEIQRYLEGVARDYGVDKHIRLNTGVTSAVWHENRAEWVLTLSDGSEVEAQFVVSATGMFGAIAMPNIPGMDQFGGTMFHSARWNHDHDLNGDRVAVVGSAASAVQFIPEIAQSASQLHVFQRTANWVLPKEDTPYTEEEREAFRRNPQLMAERRKQLFDQVEISLTYVGRPEIRNAEVVGLAALNNVVDPDVRAKLTPDHPFGCKRPLLSNNYLQTYNRSNVELVVDPIERITATGVVTTDGREREVDTIILATGFHTTKYVSAIDVVGRGGQHINQAWTDGPTAYLGLTTTGFPNLFMLYGPNTNGGNSIILMLEHQIDYLMRLVDGLDRAGGDWLDVKRDVMEGFNDALQGEISSVEVWQASCNGYYRSESGRIVTQWPHNFTEYQRRTNQVDLASFEIGRAQATSR